MKTSLVVGGLTITRLVTVLYDAGTSTRHMISPVA